MGLLKSGCRRCCQESTVHIVNLGVTLLSQKVRRGTAALSAAAEHEQVLVFRKFRVANLNLLQRNVQRTGDSTLGDFFRSAHVHKNGLGLLVLAHFNRLFPRNRGEQILGIAAGEGKTANAENEKGEKGNVFHRISLFALKLSISIPIWNDKLAFFQKKFVFRTKKSHWSWISLFAL